MSLTLRFINYILILRNRFVETIGDKIASRAQGYQIGGTYKIQYSLRICYGKWLDTLRTNFMIGLGHIPLV